MSTKILSKLSNIARSSSSTFHTKAAVAGDGPVVSYIDFSSTKLAKYYSGAYALVIDNLFSEDECNDLIALAESTETDDLNEGNGWQPAKINGGPRITDQFLDTTYRFNDRILRFDREAADKIFERVLPFVEKDIGVIKEGDKWADIVSNGRKGTDIRGIWKLLGLNERLSFLRYGPGHFFKEHCDGRIGLPDGRKSRVTIQLYLNGSESDVIKGGSTRFWDYAHKDYLDVEPKVGRALIFQQKHLLHSGEMLTQGLKYTMRTDFMYEQVFEEESEEE